jgi:hypothetical protein
MPQSASAVQHTGPRRAARRANVADPVQRRLRGVVEQRDPSPVNEWRQ